MRPLRETKRLISCAGVGSTPEGNRAVLDDLLKELRPKRPDRDHVTEASLVRIAAVAAMILLAVLIVVTHAPREPALLPTSSAADMLTVGRLNTACRRGGLPGIERQCEQAAQKLQSRPEHISMEQLFREMKGT